MIASLKDENMCAAIIASGYKQSYPLEENSMGLIISTMQKYNMFTLSISKSIKAITEKETEILINLITNKNMSESRGKYSCLAKNGMATVSYAVNIWIDRKPSKHALTDIIAIGIDALKSLLLDFVREGGHLYEQE